MIIIVEIQHTNTSNNIIIGHRNWRKIFKTIAKLAEVIVVSKGWN
jgi:hypothetical protein